VTDEEGFALRKDIGVGRHLVEVLIAGLIVAGVAVMIITVDLRATGKARALLCASNVHQLTLAMQQYADDHDGRLPLGPGWQMLVLAYSQTSDDPRLSLLTCPARLNEPGFATGLNYDVAARSGDVVGRHIWLIEVRNGSSEIWWANDIRYHRLPHNRYPAAPHRGRTTVSRGDGSVRTRDPFSLTATDWLPPVSERTLFRP